MRRAYLHLYPHNPVGVHSELSEYCRNLLSHKALLVAVRRRRKREELARLRSSNETSSLGIQRLPDRVVNAQIPPRISKLHRLRLVKPRVSVYKYLKNKYLSWPGGATPRLLRKYLTIGRNSPPGLVTLSGFQTVGPTNLVNS